MSVFSLTDHIKLNGIQYKAEVHTETDNIILRPISHEGTTMLLTTPNNRNWFFDDADQLNIDLSEIDECTQHLDDLMNAG